MWFVVFREPLRHLNLIFFIDTTFDTTFKTCYKKKITGSSVLLFLSYVLFQLKLDFCLTHMK